MTDNCTEPKRVSISLKPTTVTNKKCLSLSVPISNLNTL